MDNPNTSEKKSIINVFIKKVGGIQKTLSIDGNKQLKEVLPEIASLCDLTSEQCKLIFNRKVITDYEKTLFEHGIEENSSIGVLRQLRPKPAQDGPIRISQPNQPFQIPEASQSSQPQATPQPSMNMMNNPFAAFAGQGVSGGGSPNDLFQSFVSDPNAVQNIMNSPFAKNMMNYMMSNPQLLSKVMAMQGSGNNPAEMMNQLMAEDPNLLNTFLGGIAPGNAQTPHQEQQKRFNSFPNPNISNNPAQSMPGSAQASKGKGSVEHIKEMIEKNQDKIQKVREVVGFTDSDSETAKIIEALIVNEWDEEKAINFLFEANNK